MPLLTFTVDVRGLRQRFSALVDASTPDALAEPLLRTGGVVRARIKRDHFDAEGPGWAPLAESTQKRKLTESHVALLTDTGRSDKFARSPVRKIAREADAAAKASARAASLQQRLDDRRTKGQKTGSLEKSLAVAFLRQRKAIEYIRTWHHRSVAAGIGGAAQLVAYARAEVARAKRHGVILRAYRDARKAGHSFSSRGLTGADKDRVDRERRSLLRQGARRYKATESSTKILGGLRDSLALKLTANTIEIFSKSFIGAIHNFGGTAGHGAVIKARQFMDLAASDLDFLARACKEKMIAAWTEAA